jgi:hypothetical protein
VRSHVMHNNTCTLACWPVRAGKRGPARPSALGSAAIQVTARHRDKRDNKE